MYNVIDLKTKIENLSQNMKAHGRGNLPFDIEVKIISELEKIWLDMTDKATLPNIHGQQGLERLQDLVERMELDFSQKFAMDLQHDVQRDLEIGKIKIAFLDGVRRALKATEA